MKLYALKANEGYLRIKEEGLQTVSLKKASVFNEVDDIEVKRFRGENLTNLRIVELEIKEREVDNIKL